MPRVVVYLDAILLTGVNGADHLKNLKAFLKRLLESDLRLGLEKCAFFAPYVDYLGHLITEDGLVPDPRNVAALLHASASANKKELQRFLGFIYFYRRCMPNLSAHIQPLRAALANGSS